MNLIFIEAMSFASVTIWYVLAVIVHEAGHAVAAWAVGFRPRMINIGKGTVLARWQLGGAWVVLRARPFSGYVQFAPPPAARRLARAVVTASGPLANALVLTAILAVFALAPNWVDVWHPYHNTALATGVIAQAGLMLMTLIPAQAKIAGIRLPTDGLKLWRLITKPDEGSLETVHARLLADMLTPGAQRPAICAETPEIVYHCTRLDRRQDNWAVRQAAEAMRAILQRDAMPVAEKALVLNFLVGQELLFGPSGVDLPTLDAWSRQAVELAPTTTQRVFRAGALVALGCHAEAEAMLTLALAAKMGGAMPAVTRGFMAQALAGKGDAAGARDWMAQAHAAVPKPLDGLISPILTRMEGAVA